MEFGQFMASVLRAVTEKSFSCEPREPCTVDFTKTDWELFRAHCLDQDYYLLGDLWYDDAWLLLGFCVLLRCQYLLFFCLASIWVPRVTNVQAGMPKVLEKLMSSSTLMEHLPGHWSNLTRVKIGDLV